jgi:MYXO-CTERM domain-containing protein
MRTRARPRGLSALALLCLLWACSPPGVRANDCSTAVQVYCGDRIPGNLRNSGDDLSGPNCAGYPDLGNEDIYFIEVLNVPATLHLFVANENGRGYLDMAIARSCGYEACLVADYVDPGSTWEISTRVDAPGIYYFIVSAETPVGNGPYWLEVGCELPNAPLDCTNGEFGTLEIRCGETRIGYTDRTRIYNTSDYGCHQECLNYGPELVYRLDTTGLGSVILEAILAQVTPADADLDLFILGSCDARDGVAMSKTSSYPERAVSAPLDEGIYYIAVDGYGWSAAQFRLSVDCRPEPTATFTPSPTATPSPTPTAAPSPTATPMASPTASPSPTPTPYGSPSATPTAPPVAAAGPGGLALLALGLGLLLRRKQS